MCSERATRARCVVDMRDNQTRVIGPDDDGSGGGGTREFAFDYSFWSHADDGAHEYADQATVFRALVRALQLCAWQGQRSCAGQ